jgi:hypothetical protein
MFEIYNLVSIIQSDRSEFGRIQERIKLLGSDVLNNFKETFISQGGQGGNGLRRGEHVYQDRQVVDAFTRAGYTLESNDEDENGWAPLNQVKQPSTVSVELN